MQLVRREGFLVELARGVQITGKDVEVADFPAIGGGGGGGVDFPDPGVELGFGAAGEVAGEDDSGAGGFLLEAAG